MPESNPTETSAPMATQAGAARSIVVKFKENLTLPYVDELEEMLPSLQLMGWDAIAKLTAGSSFRRILRGFSPQNTRAIFDLAQKMNPKLQAKSVALFHHFVIEAVPEALAKEVLAALRSWPAVEYAYFAPTTVPAPTITAPAIPQSQYYLNAAPLGIDARYALQLPGGDGTGQQIVDVEAGWTLQHQGLLDAAGAPFVQLIGTLNNPSNASHGTGVLGILCGNNRCGVLGIAHHLASAAVVGHDGVSGASVHRAIELAILSLMPGIDPTRLGDPGYLNELVNAPTLPQVPGGPVLLIEVQVGRPSDPNYGMPVEIDPVVAGLLEIATAIGIVVVEAAGNGGHDLDAYPDECRGSTDRILNLNFPGEFRDTGAIMVGCGNRPTRLNPPAPTPWERHGRSNFGHRVECFSWGDNVFTLDSTAADPFGATRSNFGGTSAAAAIVAGAALVVQSLSVAQRGRACDPAEMRQLLGDATPGALANTPTETPATDLIGVMPNLQHIAINGLGIPPVQQPAPPTGLNIVGGGT